MLAVLDRETDATSAPALAMDGLRRLVRVLRASHTELERKTGITAAQIFVLKHIAEHAGGSLGDVAERTLTTQSTASEVVARLVDRGLVARAVATDDRRRVSLSATTFGRQILGASAPPVQERLIAALTRLPLAQQHAIASGLSAWLYAAGLGELEPAMFFEPETNADVKLIDNDVGESLANLPVVLTPVVYR
jgi:DNA-binding MarR family transcriptional regulator